MGTGTSDWGPLLLPWPFCPTSGHFCPHWMARTAALRHRELGALEGGDICLAPCQPGGPLSQYSMRERSEEGRKTSSTGLACGAPTRHTPHWSLPSPPPPSLCPHTPELGPSPGGLVDVTLVQWALVACLLAESLMELELQDKTHKVPAGTGWVLEGTAEAPCPGTIQLPQGRG